MSLAVCVPYNTNTYALISRTICATIHNNCFWYYLGILSFNQDKNALIKVATFIALLWKMLSKCPVQHRKNRPLHNTLAPDVDTVQEAACIQQSASGLYTLARVSGLCLGGNLCQIYYIRRPIT